MPQPQPNTREQASRTPPGSTWRQAPRQGSRGSVPAPPSPFAPDADWRAWRRARRAAEPPWAFDGNWLSSHALAKLPVVAGQLGLGDALCTLPRPRWWFGPSLHAEAAALHLPPMPDLLPVLVLHLAPGSDDLLFVDLSLGEWDCPNLCRRGGDFVSLAAWRWSLTPAKAAWRLAQTLGLGGMMP